MPVELFWFVGKEELRIRGDERRVLASSLKNSVFGQQVRFGPNLVRSLQVVGHGVEQDLAIIGPLHTDHVGNGVTLNDKWCQGSGFDELGH